MDTIKTYLESMFSSLPNNAEVRRAKLELGQMMEDKFHELIDEGKSENEAIGTVISEFGNLDELAETLGIEKILRGQTEDPRQVLLLDEAKEFLSDSSSAAFMHGLVAFFAIICASGLILAGIYADASEMGGGGTALLKGLIFLFGCIAAVIGLSVYSASIMDRWKGLKKNYRIDYATCEYVHQLRENNRSTYALLKTIGIILCALCFVPVVVIGYLNMSGMAAGIGVVVLLFMVGIGVLILVTANGREKSCKQLLRLNDAGTVGGSYVSSQREIRYENNKGKAFLSVYWSTITCIYLIYSFLTFRWWRSWIIWPIAGVIAGLLKSIWGLKDDDEE